LNAFNQLSNFGPYQISGYQTIYDTDGNVTTNVSQAFTYCWTISVYLARTSASISAAMIPLYINYTGAKNFSQHIIHPHGPLISGTFTVSVGGNPLSYSGSTDLPAAISASNLQAAFNAIPGLGNVQVTLLSNSNQAYGSYWII
jgi:hypothetical protein